MFILYYILYNRFITNYDLSEAYNILYFIGVYSVRVHDERRRMNLWISVKTAKLSHHRRRFCF